MAWTYDWGAHPSYAVVAVTGTIGRAALAALRLDIMAQPRIGEVAGYVVDFRAGDTSALTPADVRSLAATDAADTAEPALPRAFVVADGLAQGLAAVYLGHLRGRQAPVAVNVFTGVPEALAWLESQGGGITPR